MKFYQIQDGFFELNRSTAQACIAVQSDLYPGASIASGYRGNNKATQFRRNGPDDAFCVTGYTTGNGATVVAITGTVDDVSLGEFLQLTIYGGDFVNCLTEISQEEFDIVKNKALSIIMDL